MLIKHLWIGIWNIGSILRHAILSWLRKLVFTLAKSKKIKIDTVHKYNCHAELSWNATLLSLNFELPMSECPNFEIQTQTQNIDFQTAFVLFFSFFQRRKKASIYNTWIFTVRSLKKLDPLALFAPCWLISNYKWHLSHNNRRESSHWHDIYLFTCHLLRF